MKNVQGHLLNEWFLSYCYELGLTSFKQCTELLGAFTMFYLHASSEVLNAPMEELRKDFVDMLNNASFEKNETSIES